MVRWCQIYQAGEEAQRDSDLELILGYAVTFNFRHGCAVFARVGERVRLRHDLHPQRGHEGAASGCCGPQTGGDQLLPHQGEIMSVYALLWLEMILPRLNICYWTALTERYVIVFCDFDPN